MKTTIIAFACIAFLSACRKTDTVTADDTAKGLKQQLSVTHTIGPVSPENPANNFDHGGYWHNKMLAHVRSIMRSTGDSGITTIMNAMESYQGFPLAEQVHTVPEILRAVANGRENGYNSLVWESTFSEPVKQYMHNLLRLIEDTPTLDYPTIKANISSFEEAIISDRRLEASGKEILLTCTSIARHSGYYWIHEERPKTLNGERLIWWIIVVTADIAGAIGGAVKGGGDGAVLGAIAESASADALVTYSLPRSH